MDASPDCAAYIKLYGRTNIMLTKTFICDALCFLVVIERSLVNFTSLLIHYFQFLMVFDSNPLTNGLKSFFSFFND